MRQKQTKTEMENPRENKLKLIYNFFTVLWLITCLTCLGLIAWKVNKKIEVDKINNYICEIVNIDSDTGVLAMRCMAKEAE